MSESETSVPDLPLDQRFGFGKNWSSYIDAHFDESRVLNSVNVIQNFTSFLDFKDKSFIDVGCGSGLHSLAAYKMQAKSIVSFDFDPDSVKATLKLKELIGNAPNWNIMEGSVLDINFVGQLGEFDFVYSWGVLHHTGSVWQAIKNTSSLVAPTGQMYLALYSLNVQPNAEYWLKIKQKYVNSSRLKKLMMEQSYLFRYYYGGSPLKFLVGFFKHEKFRTRGMELMTDVRDWLGGWPMEFVLDEEVESFVANLGFKILRIKKGEACTEFLFQKVT
jgi:2-polyprenyl-6-hydroxyphenyl methylase/3-demethylubiquinone-9 3-methyltransferase